MKIKNLFKKQRVSKVSEPEETKEEKGVPYLSFLRSIGRLSAHTSEIDNTEKFNKLFPRTIDSIVPITHTPDGRAVAMDSSFRRSTFKNEIPNKIMRFLDTTFIGYQACSLLKQNPFIDKACTIPAKDAVAPDYYLSYINDEDRKADDANTNIDLLAVIKDEAKKKYRINEICVKQNINKKTFGVSLCVPIVDGADMEKPFNIDGIKQGSYRGMSVIEPYWVTYELDEDAATNPASEYYYEPTWYKLAGRNKRIHRSWVIKAINSPVPDILKPTYQFGGIPLTQQIFERVYAAEKVANEAPLMALTKRLLIVDANIQNMVANPTEVEETMSGLTWLRDNFGVYAKNPGDQIQQIDTSLADFDALIMTQYQLVASLAEMPATKLLKTTPKGFNATGEYEAKDYKQTLLDIEENDYLPIINRHNELYTKSEFGKVIKIAAKFNPIDTPTEHEAAEINEIKARTMTTLVSAGVVSAQEGRDILRKDEKNVYSTLPEEMEEPEFDLNFGDEEEKQIGSEIISEKK